MSQKLNTPAKVVYDIEMIDREYLSTLDGYTETEENQNDNITPEPVRRVRIPRPPVVLVDKVFHIEIYDRIEQTRTKYDTLNTNNLAAVKQTIRLHFSSYNANCHKNSYFIGDEIDKVPNDSLSAFARQNRFVFSYSEA